MIILPGQYPRWTQKNDRDTLGMLPYDLNTFWASKNIDIIENIGRIRAAKRIILNTGSSDLLTLLSYPVGFHIVGSHVYTLAGLNNVGYTFFNDGSLTGAFQVDQTTNTQNPVHTTGSGLSDITVPTPTSATYGVDHVYLVQITTAGTPDVFKWNVDGGAYTTGVSITGGNQTLSNGVVIKFAATTGHALNDVWTINVTSAPSTIDSTLSSSVFGNNAYYVATVDPSNGVWIKIYKKIGNQGWTSLAATTFDALNPICLEYFPNTARVYMGFGQNQISSWSSSDSPTTSGANYLALTPSTGDFSTIITFIKAASDRLWIGTVNAGGGKGKVYQWDGVSTNWSNAYTLESSGALSCEIINDVPHIIDTNGALLIWNGGAFVQKTQLYRRTNKLLYNPVSLYNNRFIHPKGMALVKGKLNFLIDSRNYDSTYSVEETIPAGIHEYDDTTNSIIHKHSFAMNKSADNPLTDYGASRIAGAGALAYLNPPSTSSTRNGTFLAGATYLVDATNTKSAIFYDDSNDTLQKYAYFVIAKIQANEPQTSQTSVKNTWQTVLPIYRQLLNSADKIVVKYRTVEAEPIEITGTWIATNQFTTTTDLTAYLLPIKNGAAGEVEILNGIGAGMCSHIVTQTGSGTFTITVDETYVGASGTFKARVQAWKKLAVITGQNETYDSEGVGDFSTWIEIKVCMLFTGRDEIEAIIVTNANTLPAT